ncbi:hypothetical protein [Mycolicibacterium sphagni]|uniref:Uncharacterized protein n=1 Tax=Mycolicibacterium sphagni TaxID=1786 RepID=A0ABX2JZQ3_9MYCO|nr:hypothetical protein [Mycolicibacterium sphagni]NTY62103.1 hypothetical protein [Mycolicibacterium sphagni]
MTQPTSSSGEPEWVETLLPLIMVAMIGFAAYTKRAAIIGWLTARNIIVGPEQQPLITFYAGYGIDLQRIVFLLIPAAATAVCSVLIGIAIWRNATAPRRPS